MEEPPLGVYVYVSLQQPATQVNQQNRMVANKFDPRMDPVVVQVQTEIIIIIIIIIVVVVVKQLQSYQSPATALSLTSNYH